MRKVESAIAPGTAEHRRIHDEIVGSLQLVTVELMTISYEVPPLFRLAPASDRRFELSDTVESYHFDPTLGRVAFVFKWSVGISVTPDSKLSCGARYLVLFEGIPSSAPAEVVRPCTERLGRFAAYPYLRAMTSRLFAESRLDVPLLPILREGNGARAEAGAPPTLNQRDVKGLPDGSASRRTAKRASQKRTKDG